MRLILHLVLIVAMAMPMYVAMPVPPAEAAGTRLFASGALAAAGRDRDAFREGIRVAQDRRRPGLPAFRPPRPFPGHGIIQNEIRREIRREAGRRFIGRVIGGIVIGALISVAVRGRPPGPPPGNDLCWVWSDRNKTAGYWQYCRR